MTPFYIRINDMVVSIQKWPTHKKPVLAVKFDDENATYKVASFNSVKTANWFAEILEERMK